MYSTSKSKTPVVALRTTTNPSYMQTLVGRTSLISDNIEEFRGIPYAHVSGRWEHSQLRHCLPHDVFDATENGPRCPTQSSGDSRPFQSYLPFPNVRQDEFECLNLLIVRPSKEALKTHNIDAQTNGLPVLVWIHGGGFTGGAATDPTWDTTRLVLRALKNEAPFIAVAINYRLNIFGFGASSDMLAAQSKNAPVNGLNFGIVDQKLALIWVKRNISAFGGDGTRITIMGQSAGSISCHIHLLEAELSTKKPLFRKAVLMSGAWGGLDFRSLGKADERWADLCRLRSVQAESAIDRLNMLKQIPAKDLLRSVSELRWMFFVMVIDDQTIKRSDLGCHVSFHLGHDELNDQVKAPDEKVRVYMGATQEEFSDFVRLADWNYAKFHSLFISSYSSNAAAAQTVLQAYGILPAASDRELFQAFVDFISDATMVHRVYRAGEFLGAHRGKQALMSGQDPKRVGVQFYHTEFGNPFLGPSQGIAHHGVELIYAFGNFQEALEKADRGLATGYVEPDQESTEPASSEAHSGAEMMDMVDTEAVKHGQSNIDLSHELQDKIIQFIIEDNDETDKHAGFDEVTTYCRDRSIRIDSRTSSDQWKMRRQRLDALETDLDSMLAATRRLVGSVLNMPLE